MKAVVDMSHLSFEQANEVMDTYRKASLKPDYQGIRAEVDTGEIRNVLFSNNELTGFFVFSLHYEGGAGSFYLHSCDDANEAFEILKSSVASMIR